MDLNFRALRADEVEARVGMVKGDHLTLLLYKDARCDMSLLDETVGPMNWQKSYSRDNRNCTVSIWDDEKKQWISKEDTGTESNTEKEKGLASDSFKRACFNWGIGRELYTAPFMWLKADKSDKFKVTEMVVEDRKITRVVIERSYKNDDTWVTEVLPFPKNTGKSDARKKESGSGQKNSSGDDSVYLDPGDKIDEKRWGILRAEAKKYGWSGNDIIKYLGVKKPSDITYQMEHDFIAVVPFLSKDDLDS